MKIKEILNNWVKSIQNNLYDIENRNLNKYNKGKKLLLKNLKGREKIFSYDSLPLEYKEDIDILVEIELNHEKILENLPFELAKKVIDEIIERNEGMTYDFTYYQTNKNIAYFFIKRNKIKIINQLKNGLEKDKDLIAEILVINPKEFDSMEKIFQKDIEMLEYSLSKNNKLYSYLPYELQTNEKFVDIVMNGTPSLYYLLPISYQENIKYAKKMLKEKPLDFKMLPKTLKENKDLMFLAIEGNYHVLRDMPEIIKNDELMKEIIFNKFYAFEYASEKLRSDFDFAKCCIREYYGNIKFVSGELKDNEELFMMAVGRKGDYIKYSTPDGKVRNNREIAKKALKDTPFAYEYLSKELRSDMEIFEIGLKSVYSVYEIIYSHIEPSLLKDRAFILNHIPKGGCYFFDKISDEFKNDKGLLREFIAHHPSLFKKLPENLQNDQDFLKKILIYVPEELKRINKATRNSKEFLLEFQSIITEHKQEYNKEYELLQQYLRTDVLMEKMEKIDDKSKILPNTKRRGKI